MITQQAAQIQNPIGSPRLSLGMMVVAGMGLAVLMPRVLIRGHHLIEALILGTAGPAPSLKGWPYFPTIVLPMVGVALLTFYASARVRKLTLLGSSIVLGSSFGYLDLASIAPFALLTLLAYGVVKLPISRAKAAALIVVLATFSLVAAHRWFGGVAFALVAMFQTTLIPSLWYSVYQDKGQRGRLPFHRFAVYLYARFFAAPVLTYGDLFGTAATERLDEVRIAGIRTLYGAALASIAEAYATAIVQANPLQAASGAQLLALSYIGYVGSYLGIMAQFNLVIGVLRVFGIPVRDNFGPWLLARTPNEHWQRWNTMFREWVITFVFFPIMRARRWLFIAVLAALMTSGLLHVVPTLLDNGFDVFVLTRTCAYWLLNAIAIYAVIKAPTTCPRVLSALRIRDNLTWTVVGVVLTSAFHAVLFGMNSGNNWAEVGGYFARLGHFDLWS